MKTLICTGVFVLVYFALFVIVAGFFAWVTPATFSDISGHPAYLALASLVYLIAAGFIVDDVYENLKF